MLYKLFLKRKLKGNLALLFLLITSTTYGNTENITITNGATPIDTNTVKIETYDNAAIILDGNESSITSSYNKIEIGTLKLENDSKLNIENGSKMKVSHMEENIFLENATINLNNKAKVEIKNVTVGGSVAINVNDEAILNLDNASIKDNVNINLEGKNSRYNSRGIEHSNNANISVKNGASISTYGGIIKDNAQIVVDGGTSFHAANLELTGNSKIEATNENNEDSNITPSLSIYQGSLTMEDDASLIRKNGSGSVDIIGDIKLNKNAQLEFLTKNNIKDIEKLHFGNDFDIYSQHEQVETSKINILDSENAKIIFSENATGDLKRTRLDIENSDNSSIVFNDKLSVFANKDFNDENLLEYYSTNREIGIKDSESSNLEIGKLYVENGKNTKILIENGQDVNVAIDDLKITETDNSFKWDKTGEYSLKNVILNGKENEFTNVSAETLTIAGSNNKLADSTLVASQIIGNLNKISGNNANLIVSGNSNIVQDSENSYIAGNNNNVTGENIYLTGNNIKKTEANSIFIGNGVSYIDDEAISVGNKNTNTKSTLENLEFKNTAGVVTNVGVLSMGNEKETRVIQGVSAGLVAKNSTDAINGSQLYATNKVLDNTASSIKEIFGENAVLEKDGTITFTNIGGTGKNTIDEAIASISVKGADLTGEITETETKGVTGATIHKHLSENYVKTDTISEGTFTVSANNGTKDRIAQDENINFVNGKNTTVTYDAETNKVSYSLNDDIAVKNISAGNTVINTNGITMGNTTLGNNGLSLGNGNPSISINGIDAGSKKITNVAAGTNETDAVNVGQLNETRNEIRNVNSSIAELSSEMNHIGSLSSAMAALNPMQYDKNKPTQIMAGAGHYGDKQSVAVGVAHYVNDSLLVTGGVAVGSESRSKAMANIGLTWKIGKAGEPEEEVTIDSLKMLEERIKKVEEEENFNKNINITQSREIQNHEERIKKIEKEYGSRIQFLEKKLKELNKR